MTDDTNTHSALPWKLIDGMPTDAKGEMIPHTVTNHEFIVQCVNSHNELVNALKRIISHYGKESHWDMRDIARKALKNAGAL